LQLIATGLGFLVCADSAISGDTKNTLFIFVQLGICRNDLDFNRVGEGVLDFLLSCLALVRFL